MKIDLAPCSRILDFRQTGPRWNRNTFCGFCLAGGVETRADNLNERMCVTCGNTPHKTFSDYLTDAPRIEIAFAIELTNDNEGEYRTFGHNNLSRDRRSRRNAIVREFQMLGFARKQAPLYKQRITLTRLLGPNQKLWDWDSVLRGNAKEIIDSMVELKFMVNDSPRWLVGVTPQQDDQQRSLGKGIRILIERAE